MERRHKDGQEAGHQLGGVQLQEAKHKAIGPIRFSRGPTDIEADDQVEPCKETLSQAVAPEHSVQELSFHEVAARDAQRETVSDHATINSNGIAEPIHQQGDALDSALTIAVQEVLSQHKPQPNGR
jgi:hypothetical protein